MMQKNDIASTVVEKQKMALEALKHKAITQEVYDARMARLDEEEAKLMQQETTLEEKIAELDSN